MSATARWLVGNSRVEKLGPGYGGFDYKNAYKRKYPSGAPGFVQEGLCFTLNCAWLQARESALPYPQARFDVLIRHLDVLAGLHQELSTLRDTARANKHLEMFDQFGLKRFDSEEYSRTGALASFDKQEQQGWDEFNATPGNVWQALANWIKVPAMRTKTNSGPKDLGAVIVEVYAAGGGVGHSIAIDMRHLKTKARIFDMNEGEYDVPLGDLEAFFAALEKDNVAAGEATERIDVHPFDSAPGS